MTTAQTTHIPRPWTSMTSAEHLQAAARLVGTGTTHQEQTDALALALLHTQTAVALRLPAEVTR